MSGLEGKTVAITGAASGIGRGMMRAFSAAGARVVGFDLDRDALSKVTAEVKGLGKVLDVTAADAGEQIAAHDPDILCNNAGVLDALTPLHDTSDALWDRVMAINTTAPFRIARAVVPGMIDRGGGVIINTCSAASLSGGRAGFAYTASKHALLGMTRSVAWYYRDQGIRSVAIAPGAIQTKMQFRSPPHPGGMEKYAPHFPTIGPQGKSAQVADVAVFLAGEGGSYVNGEIVSVDGGWNAY